MQRQIRQGLTVIVGIWRDNNEVSQGGYRLEVQEGACC